jgi:hypothetical protein
LCSVLAAAKHISYLTCHIFPVPPRVNRRHSRCVQQCRVRWSRPSEIYFQRPGKESRRAVVTLMVMHALEYVHFSKLLSLSPRMSLSFENMQVYENRVRVFRVHPQPIPESVCFVADMPGSKARPGGHRRSWGGVPSTDSILFIISPRVEYDIGATADRLRRHARRPCTQRLR